MAERPITLQDVNDAYKRGRADADQELLPFHGVGRVAFPRDRPHFPGTVLYEKQLLEYEHSLLRELEDAQTEEARAKEHKTAIERRGQELVEAASGSNRFTTKVRRIAAGRQASIQRERAQQDLAEAADRCSKLGSRLEKVRLELGSARAWLDEHVDLAQSYYAIRDGVRRSSKLPGSVTAYSVEAFIAEDPDARRGFEAFDPGGRDYGYKWTWEPPDRPWEITRWRISWLDNGEIYARDVTHGRDPAESRLGERALLLLGNVPRDPMARGNFLVDLENSVDPRERNTLVRAAETVAEHQRRLAHLADDDIDA